ncbi:MAG: hypothetical protein V4640_13575 [Verrucomicrobiota bacterium]
MKTSTRSARRKCPSLIARGIFFLFPVLLIALLLPSCGLLNLGLLKLQFGCVPEGVCIDTPSGPVPIEKLKAGDTVIGFNGDPVRVSQIHQYQEDPATSRHVTVHFTNGGEVRVSARHRIAGTPAGSLRVDDACGSQTVTAIGEIRGTSRSFDLLTEDPGYRIDGIPVNSMIQEMLSR